MSLPGPLSWGSSCPQVLPPALLLTPEDPELATAPWPYQPWELPCLPCPSPCPPPNTGHIPALPGAPAGALTHMLTCVITGLLVTKIMKT